MKQFSHRRIFLENFKNAMFELYLRKKINLTLYQISLQRVFKQLTRSINLKIGVIRVISQSFKPRYETSLMSNGKYRYRIQ